MNLRFAICCVPILAVLLAGCNRPQTTVQSHVIDETHAPAPEPNAAQPVENTVKPTAPVGAANFAVAKVSFLPLTELSSPSGANQGAKLRVFVALLDAFGSQIKAPGTLRFELYEYVPRSAQLKGQRLAIWPDIDLTGPAENNRYWRDFLRAYEFELDARVSPDKTYILEVTCLSPEGKRFSSEYTLRGSLP